MDSINITANGTRPTSRPGRGSRGSNRRSESLSSEEKLTETILSSGVLPVLCILGLLACTMYLHTIRRKGRITNPYPIVIAIFDAIYLLLTLEERIHYSLTTIFGVLKEGIDKEIQSSLKRVAKCALSIGTAILCVHAIEACYAVLRPMTYRTIWTKKNRLLIAAFVITLDVLFFVSCEVADVTIDDSLRPTFLSVRNALEDGLFSILSISIMVCCYIIVIVRRVLQIRFKSATKSSNKKDQTDKIITSLMMASSVYFVFGIPMDAIKLILIYDQSVSRQGVAFWVVKVVQNTTEVLFGSVLLCVYVLNEVSPRIFRCPCGFHLQMSTDKANDTKRHQNGRRNSGIEERET